MGGLAVLFLFGLYCVLAVVAIVKVKPIWVKGLVLLAAFLIPTADAVYGRYKLKQMCAAEGGLKVYRVAEGVEGFMGYAHEGLLTKPGYQFVEKYISSGKYYSFSKQNGQIIREDYITPKSKYRLRETYDDTSIYKRGQLLIENIATGEVLATDTQLIFEGGWAERFLAQFSGSGGGSVAWCNDTPDILIRKPKIVISTLKP